MAERATMATAPMVVGRCHHPGVAGLFATMSECSTLSKSTSPLVTFHLCDPAGVPAHGKPPVLVP